ncbi:MAG TPA: carboxypeptidase regulatory-like domain-containing protein, partial [Vicinamibacteria bacterium]
MKPMFLAVVLLGASAAQAGTITGSVPVSSAAEADRTVVYVETAPVAPGTSAKRAKLLQKGARFSPTVLPIMSGTDVDMTNDDWVAHNVFSKSETKPFDLGVYPPGSAQAVSFERSGTVDVFCAIHPRMNAVVLVLQNPYFAKPDAQGRFTIEGVPTGSYSLRVYRLGGGPASQQQVKVAGDGSAS